MTTPSDFSTMIPFHEQSDEQQGFFYVRRVGRLVAITISLERGGDVEASVEPEIAGKLIAALNQAVQRP